MRRIQRTLWSATAPWVRPLPAPRSHCRTLSDSAPVTSETEPHPAPVSDDVLPSSKPVEATPPRTVRLKRGSKTLATPPATLAALRRYLGLSGEKPASGSGPAAALDPVFVAIDVEAFEFDTKKVTEVGIATLDSRHLTHPPSPLEWAKQIRTRHFIISEHKHLRNKRHVKGCPDNFLFGQSTLIPLKQMAATLQLAFTHQDPHSTQSGHKSPRNVVLVGHDVGGDLQWIHKLGYSLVGVSQLVGLVDTQKIARALALPEGLQTVLLALGERPKYLHNGGNDAHYTMQAALLFALYGSTVPEPPTMEVARQVRAAKMEAVLKMQQERQEAIKSRSEERNKKSEVPSCEPEEADELEVMKRQRDEAAKKLKAMERERDKAVQELEAMTRQRDEAAMESKMTSRLLEEVGQVPETTQLQRDEAAKESEETERQPEEADDELEVMKQQRDEAAEELVVMKRNKDKVTRELSTLRIEHAKAVHQLKKFQDEMVDGSSPVRIYEKLNKDKPDFIGGFVSPKRASRILGVSAGTIVDHIRSGTKFRERYSFAQK